jgi:hypothetical protein
MSTVKKWLPVSIVIIAIASMVFVSGCGDMVMLLGQQKGEVKASETAPATKEIVAESKVNGTIYETDKFSILQPDGWKATETSGGVVLEKGEDALMVTVGDDTDSTEAFIKELMAKMAEQQNGTPVEEVSMLGGKFFQTRFTSEGKDMTMAYGLTNGLVVNLAITGKDHPNNVEIKAMLDSIKFK